MNKVLIYSLLIFIILCFIIEFYFRFFTSYCEPWFDRETKIVKRKKNTEGFYKTEYTNNGYFRINNEGWNSNREYHIRDSLNISSNDKNEKVRIAIIGHSNIEGLRVHFEKTLSKVLEDKLLKKGIITEVYTFGFGGMHLAQALHVSRTVVKKFQPDVIIIGTLIDNFIHETTDKDNFLSISINENGQIKEIIPDKYKEEYSSPISFLYFSKAIKYFDIRLQLGKKQHSMNTKNSEESKISDLNHYELLQDSIYEKKVLLGVNYIFSQFLQIHPKLYFINFPQKSPSYNYQESNIPNYIKSHHKSIIDLIKKFNFPVINLEKAFMDDYEINHLKFDFPNDGHYNEHAHYVIGNYLADYFINNVPLNNNK